jgi:hypothetical protein
MIVIKMIVLGFFYMFIEVILKHQFTKETQFNCYRSLVCIYFTFTSLKNTIMNIEMIQEPFDMKSDDFTDISIWFILYLLFDILIMIHQKNKRVDLYIHHVYCIVTYGMALYYDKIGFIFNFLLICEAISIVNGLDSIYLEKGDMMNSINCKIYRKNVIKYLRLPIWISLLLFILYHNEIIDPIIFWNGLVSSIMLIGLDIYWEEKCNKIINNIETKKRILFSRMKFS